MIHVTLPNGAVMLFEHPISGYHIAESTSKGLAQSALAVNVNGVEKDLSSVIDSDASITFLTKKDNDILPLIRYDAAHVLGEALTP